MTVPFGEQIVERDEVRVDDVREGAELLLEAVEGVGAGPVQDLEGDGGAEHVPGREASAAGAIVFVPVSIGMLINRFSPDRARRMNRPVRILSAVVLVLVIIGAILKDRANFFGYFQQVGLAALTFNLVSLAVGYAAPRLLRMSRPQAIAIGMEVGIHNGTLAIAIAASPFLLNNRTMAIPPAIYSLIMFITAAAFGFLTSARRAPSSPRAATAR